MKRWMSTMLPSMAVAGTLLAGCAGTPDCSDGRATAEQAALERAPLGAWLDGVDTGCRGSAEQTWRDALRADCDPLFGFHAGHRGLERPDDCGDPGFEQAWNLGSLIGEMGRERQRIEARLADGDLADVETRRLQQRITVIDRDLPQVEALARMQGFLPEAEVPGGPAD